MHWARSQRTGSALAACGDAGGKVAEVEVARLARALVRLPGRWREGGVARRGVRPHLCARGARDTQAPRRAVTVFVFLLILSLSFTESITPGPKSHSDSQTCKTGSLVHPALHCTGIGSIDSTWYGTWALRTRVSSRTLPAWFPFRVSC